jgi:glycerol uptake facilitator protein
MPMSARGVVARAGAVVLGTFILVFFGCGAVHSAALTGALTGLWQVAIVWGVAIMVAIYVVGNISGAHINPAITLALALWRKFPWAEVPGYVLSQLLGAALAALVLFGLYSPFLEAREREHGVVRGEAGSETTAMCYGEYFPNPGNAQPPKTFSTVSSSINDGGISTEPARPASRFTLEAAFLAEVLGTALLSLVVFALTDERNRATPLSRLGPVFIGLTVSILIAVIAPLTQACFNPARDVGPRVVAYFAGWGPVAIPGPRPGFWLVYIVAPLVGGALGGAVYTLLLQPNQPAEKPIGEEG